MVESATGGGAMITARCAGEQGRTVLAVPTDVSQFAAVQALKPTAVVLTPSYALHLAEWAQLKAEAVSIGFREPWPQESLGAFKTAMSMHRPTTSSPPSERTFSVDNLVARMRVQS